MTTMKLRTKILTLTGAAGLLLSGCGAPMDPLKGAKSDKKGAPDGKYEAWGPADSPSIFSSALEYRLASLPDTGAATNVPWASSYWPVYEDSINYKWGNDDSAPKKYERAFGGTGVEDAVSAYHGIDSQTGRKECKATSECSDLKDGSECAKRPGKDTGRCIPTWWGICHAWTPAAIMLPEPKHEVTKNGVTFRVMDIKALVTLVHNRTTSKFVSLRCERQEGYDGLPDNAKLHYDDYGRPADTDRECRDTNAGTYHVLLANYLGIMHQSFAEDRTFNYEVWNQPLRAFRVTEKKEVTSAEANRLIGVSSVGGTTDNKTAIAVAKDAWQHFGPYTVAAGQSFKVVMSGDNDADLHVAFGAQPTDSSYACRPYGGNSDETCDVIAPAGATKAYVSVKGYAATSTIALKITYGGGTPTAYAFNPAATKFFAIKSEVDYIGESSASTDGNLSSTVDRYTHTDYYEYILEVDANGKIIGGEWLNGSKKAHPDFLWLPTGVSGSSVAGGKITYAQVKQLLDESVADTTPTPTTGGTQKTVTDAAAIAKGAWKQYGPYDLAAGATLKADLTGDGDADLYVRKDSAPTLTGYDCRPYAGTSAESCSIVGPAKIYVGVNGYAATSNVQLKVVYTEGTGGGTTNPPPATFNHLNQTGSLAQGELKVFQLPIPAGKKVVIRTTSATDVDLYIQFGGAPTTESYLDRGYTTSGNETITWTATSNGTLFIAVHGYAAGSFTVKTSDN
jgi:hypothetical protein